MDETPIKLPFLNATVDGLHGNIVEKGWTTEKVLSSKLRDLDLLS